MGLEASECILVGDRIETDIHMALESGMKAALVMTGVNDEATLEASPFRPDYLSLSFYSCLKIVLLFQIDVFLGKVLGTTDCSLTTCFASYRLPDRWGDGDPNRLENFATDPEAFATNHQGLASVFYRNLLEGLEILFDVGPFGTVAGLRQPAIQLLPDDQGQEAAKNVNPDGFIPLVVDGPGRLC